MERHRLAAKSFQPLKRAVGGDGEVEHLEPPVAVETLAAAVLVKPFLKQVAVGLLVAHAPAHVHRRPEHGDRGTCRDGFSRATSGLCMPWELVTNGWPKRVR